MECVRASFDFVGMWARVWYTVAVGIRLRAQDLTPILMIAADLTNRRSLEQGGDTAGKSQ